MDYVPNAFDWLARNAEALTLGAIVAAVLVLVMLGLRWLGHRMVANDSRCIHWQGVVGRVLSKTSILFMVATALDTVARYADMPPRPAHLLDALFTIAAALQAAVWARELVLGVIHRNVGEEPGATTLGNAYGVIRVIVSVALFGLALVAILDNLGVNVTALVAGLGVGGIAIGLAAQGIFSDLFAALAILFDKPFRRGDTIRYDTTVGTVERIGMKTTRLRSPTGEQIIMANTKLLEREIHNLAAAQRRRVVVTFALGLRTPAARLSNPAAIAATAVRAVPGCTLVRCVVTGFGSTGLDHELIYDDDSLDPDANAARKATILATLLSGLEQAGLLLATPTQTAFLAMPDGTLVPPYPEAAALP
ncbi:mechanosensitive ion channel family protein [Sphingomonas sp.]|uniref:mechanosensitive ion channel family protein n=1 Tax=Sphingomonas sp. TaxID=28214 RepID=UPI00286AC3A3|nr:mechanosensitive ion channel family protein [Sphingomonas sp.]